ALEVKDCVVNTACIRVNFGYAEIGRSVVGPFSHYFVEIDPSLIHSLSLDEGKTERQAMPQAVTDGKSISQLRHRCRKTLLSQAIIPGLTVLLSSLAAFRSIEVVDQPSKYQDGNDNAR